MASNPMQRKSRNAFLLGIIVALLVAGVLVTPVVLKLKQKSEELQAELSAKRNVYVLAQDVKGGQTLTQDMFELKTIHSESIPSNATAAAEVIESWFLQTKEGEYVNTIKLGNEYGLYLDRVDPNKSADTIIEVISNTGVAFKDSNNKEVANGETYIIFNGKTEKITSSEGIIEDQYGKFLVDTQGKDKMTRVFQEELTGEYYTFKLNPTTKVREKQYVEIKNVPVLARVDMNANTVITPKLVVQSDEIITDDTRQEEYNMIVLPVDLMTNDYVDIRFMTPEGQNFIVVSKVQVEVPMNADGTYLADTIRVDLREDEILAMSSAIVEAYGLGAKIYVTKYVDPAMQQAAMPTYTPNAAVTAQIDANGDSKIDNPNIVEEAMKELATRYSEAAKAARNRYLQEFINRVENYNENINESLLESMGNSITARQQYLESLGITEE